MRLQQPKADAHWRDSARNIKFFIWDGKAAFPFLLFFMYMRLWTLIFAVVATMFFTLLNRYGFKIEVFGRYIRSMLVGRRKMTQPWWQKS